MEPKGPCFGRLQQLVSVVVVVVLAVCLGGWVLAVSRDAATQGTVVHQHSSATAALEAGTAGLDSVTAFGTAVSAAPTASLPGLSSGIVGMAATPDGDGYWLVGSDGGVFAYGDAGFYGSMGSRPLNLPVVGMAATSDGAGYWLVASDGGVFAFGDAGYFGSMGGQPLDMPVVGMAAAPGGDGYWLVASDGGVFAFGDAPFEGSTGGMQLNEPVVGMAAAPGGDGYWLVASDGGVFAFGDAPFEGSTGGMQLNEPVVGMAAAPGGAGYWLVALDGGVFAFGDAPFEGSDGGVARSAPAVAIAGRPGGYWIAYGQDRQSLMIPAIANYVASRTDNVTVAVEDLSTGQILQFRPAVIENTASTLKVDILATLLTEAQSQDRAFTPAEQALAVPMIEDSLDSAADILWGQLGPGPIGAFERAVGMTSTAPATDGIWGTTTTTALDRLDIMRSIVEPDSVLSDASRSYLLELMENITPTQDWGATGGVPPGVTVALKNGFAVIDGWQINTEGWVSGDGRNYLIGVLTNGNPSESYGIDTVNAISAIVWQDMTG